MPMTPETLKRLEELYDKWCNDPSSPDRDVEIPARVMDHLPDLIAAVKERDQFKAELSAAHDLYAMTKTALDKAIDERDAAQKACAEMRDALIRVWQLLYNASQLYAHKPDWLVHALSTDCGKDWVPKPELDAANVKCAEMRQLLVESPKPWRATHGAAQQDREWFKRRDHAISTDCGRGYHHERDVGPLLYALKEILEWQQSAEKEWLESVDISVPKAYCEDALAHWERRGK